MVSGMYQGRGSHGIYKGSILFANHKANGVVTNIGLSR